MGVASAAAVHRKVKRMFNEQDFDRILSATVYDANGDKVGKVGQLYLDDQTGRPSWVTVNTGLFGLSESFVPIDDTLTVNDDRIDVAYSKDLIKDAPRIDADGHLDPSQEQELYSYYERDYVGHSGDVTQADLNRDRDLRDDTWREDDGALGGGVLSGDRDVLTDDRDVLADDRDVLAGDRVGRDDLREEPLTGDNLRDDRTLRDDLRDDTDRGLLPDDHIDRGDDLVSDRVATRDDLLPGDRLGDGRSSEDEGWVQDRDLAADRIDGRGPEDWAAGRDEVDTDYAHPVIEDDVMQGTARPMSNPSRLRRYDGGVL